MAIFKKTNISSLQLVRVSHTVTLRLVINFVCPKLLKSNGEKFSKQTLRIRRNNNTAFMGVKKAKCTVVQNVITTHSRFVSFFAFLNIRGKHLLKLGGSPGLVVKGGDL